MNQQYIGAKLIRAIAMSRASYNDFRGWKLPDDELGSDEGYLVEYLDGGKPNVAGYAGYVSWSPKEQFDNAYRPCDGLSFGLAMEAMKRGQRVTRAGWNGKGLWIALCSGVPALEAGKFWSPHARAFAEARGGACAVRPYMLLKTAQGDIQMGWAPSGSDALADD